jgi:hypothetical protein
MGVECEEYLKLLDLIGDWKLKKKRVDVEFSEIELKAFDEKMKNCLE